jgi:hypothetical protein
VIRAAAALAVLAVTAPAAEGALRFERQNGKAVAMPGPPAVWCGAWDTEVAEPALHVAVPPGSRNFWHLSVVRRDLSGGGRFGFPNDFVFDRPKGALVFAVDGLNELSSAEEEAAGRMYFERVSCRPGARIAFRIRATLGSEVSGPTLRVAGRFRGRVAGSPPAWASSAS